MATRVRYGALLISAGLALSACAHGAEEGAIKVQPARVQKVEGSSVQRVILTSKAAERLGIKTAPLREISQDGASPRKAVDYSAIVYDPDGHASVYTNPEQLVFVRQSVVIDSIEGEQVFISDGPPLGTAVVTVGTPELYGIDAGIGGNE